MTAFIYKRFLDNNMYLAVRASELSLVHLLSFAPNKTYGQGTLTSPQTLIALRHLLYCSKY